MIGILKRYRELSFQLWYRGVEVKCYYLGSDLVPLTFDPVSSSSSSSTAMEIHSALEERVTPTDKNLLTGRRVMVITKPAIVAHWVDQEDYKLEERSKVWVKAMAWVYAREEGAASFNLSKALTKRENEHQYNMDIGEKSEELYPNTDIGAMNDEPLEAQDIGKDSDKHGHDGMDIDIEEKCHEHQQNGTSTLDEKSNEPWQGIDKEGKQHQQDMEIDKEYPKTKQDNTALDEKSNEPRQIINEESKEHEHQQDMDIGEGCHKTKQAMIDEH